MDGVSVDFFPYGLFPFSSIREHGVCQWRGSKELVKSLDGLPYEDRLRIKQQSRSMPNINLVQKLDNKK